MNKKMSLKDVEYCVNPQKMCKDCKYNDQDEFDCRGEALSTAAKVVEEKIKEKEHKMIDKAIDKIGINRDLIDQCYYPVSSFEYITNQIDKFKEDAVCITLKELTVGAAPLALLVFGLEDSDA